jgi:hypothetical protein
MSEMADYHLVVPITFHRVVWIDYTNWKGERRIRRVLPERIMWGSDPYHTKPQFLLSAQDPEKGTRTFAMKDIHAWDVEPPQ